MVSTTLFNSRVMPPPVTNTVNAVGGAAYRRDARAALARYAATGCLRGTCCAGAELQLADEMTMSLH
jgi:60 kDa SS-A/Ro ribonucleoprotein